MGKGEDWAGHLKAQAKSGESLAAYCRERGLSKRALYKYRLKAKEKSEKQLSFVQITGAESRFELVLGEWKRVVTLIT